VLIRDNPWLINLKIRVNPWFVSLRDFRGEKIAPAANQPQIIYKYFSAPL